MKVFPHVGVLGNFCSKRFSAKLTSRAGKAIKRRPPIFSHQQPTNLRPSRGFVRCVRKFGRPNDQNQRQNDERQPGGMRF
jgi:hypothetical protein